MTLPARAVVQGTDGARNERDRLSRCDSVTSAHHRAPPADASSDGLEGRDGARVIAHESRAVSVGCPEPKRKPKRKP